MKSFFSLAILLMLSIVPPHHSEERVLSVEPLEKLNISVTKSNFDIVYKRIRFEEGNYAYVKNDLGKETYGGITRKYNPKWEGWLHIDVAKIKDGKRTTKLNWNQKIDLAEPAVRSYYQDWWQKWNMDVISDSTAAAYTFDMAICGTPSIKLIKQCLIDLGMKHVKINGYITLKEVEYINSLNPIIYVETLRLLRKDFYNRIANRLHKVRDNHGKYVRDSLGNHVYAKTQKKFLKGWLSRADRMLPELKARVNIKRHKDNKRL